MRYLSLNVLYSQEPVNLIVIDKLSLAILKAFDEKTTLAWLDERKEPQCALTSISEKGVRDVTEKFGQAIAIKLVEDAPSIYELCRKRVTVVAEKISQHGPLYYDFESDIELYKKDGFVERDFKSIKEFNSLMGFLCLGWKPRFGDLKK